MVADYIQKRRGEPGLFSFEYNLLPKLISNFYALHGPGIRMNRRFFFHFASALFFLQGRRNQKNLYYLLASKITKKLSVSFTLKGNLDVVCILFVTDLSQPTTPRYLLKFQHASSRLTFRAKTTGHFWKKEQTVNNLLNLRKHHMQLMTLVTGEKWKVHANIASNSSNFVFSMF